MLLDGKATAAKIREKVKEKVSKLDKKPGLAVVRVGDDPASTIYVNKKEKMCLEVGIYSEKHVLDENVSEEELLNLVERLNLDANIHGILVQLPLPKHINEQKVLKKILPKKDVDGFHVVNAGNLLQGMKGIRPATPKGIMRLLEEYDVDIEGKDAVIVGRSNIVGKPIALMLLEKNATVTICHSRTKNLEDYTKKADIIVSAVGRPKMITADMVKEGVVIIDVGINRIDGKLVGDVDFENVKDKASYITPVPGGVGPMTIATLLENCLECYDG